MMFDVFKRCVLQFTFWQPGGSQPSRLLVGAQPDAPPTSNLLLAYAAIFLAILTAPGVCGTAQHPSQAPQSQQQAAIFHGLNPDQAWPDGALGGLARPHSGTEAVAALGDVEPVAHTGKIELPNQTAPTSGSAGRLQVVFFYSSMCSVCVRSEGTLSRMVDEYGQKIQVELYDVEDVQLYNRMFLYEDHYGSKETTPPKVFVGQAYLAGDDSIADKLERTIQEALAKGETTYVPSEPNVPLAKSEEAVPQGIMDRFRGFSVGAVVVAGLLDGINPCAFTTIVFLLSMLANLGKKKRDLAIVGIGFTLAVFGTYLLLGLGMLRAIKIFSVTSGVATVLVYLVAGLAFVLAAWSAIDAIRYFRSKDVKTVTLALPTSIKNRIHKVIRSNLNTRSLLVGSLTIGFAVSVLESACTGQLYLPTIVFVTRSPELRANGFAYLLLYNVMFILPLVGILAVAYMGVKSQFLAKLLQTHLVAMKLALAVLFVALGILIITTV